MSEWAVYGKVKRFAAQRFPPARSPHFASWELEPQASCSGERTHGLAGEGRDIGDRSGLLEPRPRQGTRNGFPACALSSLHEQSEGTLASGAAASGRCVIPHVTPLALARGLGPGVSRIVGPGAVVSPGCSVLRTRWPATPRRSVSAAASPKAKHDVGADDRVGVSTQAGRIRAVCLLWAGDSPSPRVHGGTMGARGALASCLPDLS